MLKSQRMKKRCSTQKTMSSLAKGNKYNHVSDGTDGEKNYGTNEQDVDDLECTNTSSDDETEIDIQSVSDESMDRKDDLYDFIDDADVDDEAITNEDTDADVDDDATTDEDTDDDF